MKCYCDDFPFLISEFNTVNRKYQQFKWISVPSEGESSTGHNRSFFLTYNSVDTKKFPKREYFPMLWHIVLIRVSLRLTIAIWYAVGNPILTQVAFITTWLSKWGVLRAGIMAKGSSRKTMELLSIFPPLMTNTITLSDMSLKKTRSK